MKIPILIFLFVLVCYSEGGQWGLHRTVIRVQLQGSHKTQPGEDVWIRGGQRSDSCNKDQPIYIQHNNYTPHLPTYNPYQQYQCFDDWKTGDLGLDWGGRESGQSRWCQAAHGQPSRQALGTPMLHVKDGHYWATEFLMWCDKVGSGGSEYFEFKFYHSRVGWEQWRNQGQCTGNQHFHNPTGSTGNHVARCGRINTYTFDQNNCECNNLNYNNNWHWP